MQPAPYRGRFAPTPSGPLHAGSVAAALASWLDARAHAGSWLIRLEDTDGPRCAVGAAEVILHQLSTLGLVSDEPVEWQSRRVGHYEKALAQLKLQDWVYPCHCSRQMVRDALAAQGIPKARWAQAVYPGTCRSEPHPRRARTQPAWRLRCDSPALRASQTPVLEPPVIQWEDRRLGPQSQHLAREVGDFVLLRADGIWAYQLAVVVDDALQGITDVVRGEDLADNTPRQIHLQTCLGVPQPRYLHTPLVYARDGQKLSKQTGAPAIDLQDPLKVLQSAAAVLGLVVPPQGPSGSGSDGASPAHGASDGASAIVRWLERATQAWGMRWGVRRSG